MYYPSYHRISKLRHGKKFLIPLNKELDFWALPQDIYKNGPFLLESCRNNQKTGRFSFIGVNPFLTFKAKGLNVFIEENGSVIRKKSDPVRELRVLFSKYKSLRLAGISGFTGGAVGYFSYECRHLFENLPKKAYDDLNLPDIFLVFVDTVIVFDHFENKISIVSNIYPDKPLKEAYDEAVEKIERLELSLRCRGGACPRPNRAAIKAAPTRNDVRLRSNFTKPGFEKIVRRAKEYIADGDIYQANLSQRFCADIDGQDVFGLYQRLSKINPSPFACFLDFGEIKIAGSSPERLLKLEKNTVQTRPIAGTRPKGKTAREDIALSRELILSDKERAEHIMLVDLERNDLGRVCEYSSVKVDELMILENYSHVKHIVSNVTGKLKSSKDRFDLLKAVFPGGTITGCPKIRCMEIIDELEPVARNIYTGSIGYLDFNGGMDLNIAIRTFIIKGNKAYVQTGAGIVADSNPQKEYNETLYKAQALFKALQY